MIVDVNIVYIICCSSSYFHVVDGLVPYILQDLLEGVLQYEVKLLLHHLIYEEHFFTLEQLETSVWSHLIMVIV